MGKAGDAAMATDYDAPRRGESDAVVEGSLEVLQERHRAAQSPVVDIEETDTAEDFDLPGADLSGEELLVRSRQSRLTSSPARPASWSTTDSATPANAPAGRSVATALPELAHA